MRIVLPAALLLSAMLILTGCAAGGDDDGFVRPDLTSMPAFGADDVLPFDAYSLPHSDLERMQSLEASLLGECTAEHGVPLEFYGDFIRPSQPDYTYWGGRIGTMTTEHAAAWGYHAAPDEIYALSTGNYLSTLTNLGAMPGGPALSDAVLYGIGGEDIADLPDGGCHGWLERELDAPIVEETDLIADVSNLAWDDDRVAKAMGSWITCMSSRGYDFKTVQDAAQSRVLTTLDQTETRLATDDVECTAASNWANLYYAVLGDYQKQATTRYAQRLQAVLDAQKARLAALERVAAEHGID